MQAAIHYRVAALRPASHRFQVSLVMSHPDPQGQRLWLPDWIPGSYMIRDFARNIGPLRVVDAEGHSVAITALDKSSWQCAAATGPLTVSYEVYAWDLSVRSAHLDQTHGYFNGTSLFLAVAGQEEAAVSVDLVHPEGVEGEWRVATTLPSRGAPELGFGRYGADSYDELIDHPVEMGSFDYAEFTACGVPHAVAVTGRHRGDLARLTRDLQRICEAQIRFFGEPAPFQRYLFQIMAVGQGYGGLEHRSSTSLLCSRDELPQPGEAESKPSNGYRSLLGLCSHEYFHSWNVKRLKPAEFLPYDLRRENHTHLLWFFEGVTSYYDDLFLLRTGLISAASYLELLAQQITRHLRTPGRAVQSVSESSFQAWTKYYKTDENTPNSVVSYYVKGSLVALCLDLELRRLDSSLDALMRLLWRDFALAGRGVSEADIRAGIRQLTGGDALEAFLDLALHGTEELPWQELLESCGIGVQLRAAEGSIDAGGRPGVLTGERPWLGVRTQAAEGGVQLSFVQHGGPAEAAGLSAGDLVVALDKLRVSSTNWEKRLWQHAVGDNISVYAFRRDEWFAVTCQLAAAPLDTCVLTLPAESPARTLSDRWLLHI